jgi:hypothetical protein
MANDTTQIRSLPRSGEILASPEPQADRKLSRGLLVAGLVSIAATALMLALPSPKTKPSTSTSKTVAAKPEYTKTELSSSDNRISNVDRYLNDGKIRQQMMMRKSEIENQQFRTGRVIDSNAQSFLTLPATEKNLGVQLDGENAAENVYEDLHDTTVTESTLPADLINAEMVKRKWVTELDRRQRILFVSNFIKSARDQGYDVEIDQNLVVVGVRRINETKKLDINQIMDRLARDGR